MQNALTEQRPSPLPSSENRTAPMSCPQSDWLMANNPRMDNMPAEIVAELPRLIREADLAIRPSTAQEFAVAIDQLWDWAARFNIQADVRGQTQKYRELLGNLPPDILLDAIKETVASHNFRTIPLPGDIKKRASHEFERRRTIRIRARTMAMYARWQGKLT